MTGRKTYQQNFGVKDVKKTQLFCGSFKLLLIACRLDVSYQATSLISPSTM